VRRVTDDETVAPETTPTTTPRTGPIWIVLFVALVVCTQLSSIITSLAKTHPLLLVGLSARNRNIVLTAPVLPVWQWMLVAGLRLALSATVCHMIGRVYGDRALRWFWRFLGMPQEQVARFEQQIAKAEWIVVPFFVGSNIVWALTGAAATTWKRLVPMFAVGIVARFLLLWWLSRVFREELLRITTWMSDNQLWLILVSLVVVVLVNVRNFRNGR
jgi:membrane protein DedA with SNARE-associated domain